MYITNRDIIARTPKRRIAVRPRRGVGVWVWVPAPPTALTRRREEEAVWRSLRTGSTHGAVRGPSGGRGWGLRQRRGRVVRRVRKHGENVRHGEVNGE